MFTAQVFIRLSLLAVESALGLDLLHLQLKTVLLNPIDAIGACIVMESVNQIVVVLFSVTGFVVSVRDWLACSAPNNEAV